MEFENAIGLLKKHRDNYMMLDKWTGDTKIRIWYPGADSKHMSPYFYTENVNGKFQWIPNTTDMFSDKWIVKRIQEKDK